MPKAWFCSVCGRSAFQLWRGFIEGFLLDSFECILAMIFVCNSHLLMSLLGIFVFPDLSRSKCLFTNKENWPGVQFWTWCLGPNVSGKTFLIKNHLLIREWKCMPWKLVSWCTPSKLEHDVKGDGELIHFMKCEVSYFLQFRSFPKRCTFVSFIFIWVFSKNRYSTPKWMVKKMENPIKIGWFGGKTHYFRKHSSIFQPHL